MINLIYVFNQIDSIFVKLFKYIKLVLIDAMSVTQLINQSILVERQKALNYDLRTRVNTSP